MRDSRQEDFLRSLADPFRGMGVGAGSFDSRPILIAKSGESR